MKRSGSKLLCILLLLSLLLSLTACGKPETQLEKTAGYLQAQIAEPGTGSVGGDWLIFGLARSGVKVPQKYFDAYYENVEAAVREKNGVLSDRKYTEYSRTVLALTAIGKNPADVAGYDLLKPLADFEQVTRQGINGTIFALLALDSGNYEIPENPDAAVQATRQMYVDELLTRELPDGGWTLTGGEPDVDITAMTLQALAKYRGQPEVEAAVERGHCGPFLLAGAGRRLCLVGVQQQRIGRAGDRGADGTRRSAERRALREERRYCSGRASALRAGKRRVRACA